MEVKPPIPQKQPTSELTHSELSGLKLDFELVEGFSRPDWKALASFVRERIPKDDWGVAWSFIAEKWLEQLARDLGGGAEVSRSRSFLCVSDLGRERVQPLLAYAESVLRVIRETLGEAAWTDYFGKHVLLIFSDHDDYLAYVSYFYDEGTHPLSGGVFIRRGYAHVVLPYTQRVTEHVLVHELVHNLVCHLRIPAWLNEGLAMLVEQRMSSSPFLLDKDMVERHYKFWDERSIQSFWAGRSFHVPGEEHELGYSLAEILANLLVGKGPVFITFIQSADWRDAGQDAALKVLGRDLSDVAGEFLGPGDWRPQRKAMSDLWNEKKRGVVNGSPSNRGLSRGFPNVCVWVLCAASLLSPGVIFAQSDTPLAQRRWFEARTAHFHTYSCGQTQEVAQLTARLEQFREAYSALAGNEAVASPPIVVMAFPDHASMKSFVPLYQGKPATIEAFFMRGSDENLIVLPLSGTVSLEVIFHEYTHLLMRHNDAFWPIWLKEGMAEVYGTFEVTGQHTARIGLPLARHLRLLSREPLMPLKQLLEVAHESPEYNERDRQGVFYAQSWLLTHYLMLGNNGSRRAGLGQFTALLRQGQTSEQAFAKAFHTTLAGMNNELRAYLARERFQPLALTVNVDLLAPRQMSTRVLPPVEVWFRLGDELMRVHRFETAEACFLEAQKLSPTSPLPCEGLGLLAAERDHSDEAMRWLGEALHRGSKSFLAHYEYAHEKFEASATKPGWHARLEGDKAADIRAELHKSLELMPDFGPAHHLLGLFEFIQHDDLAGAVQHLQRAIQLEPENQVYLISLAQAQFEKDGAEAARRTLEPLRLPYVEPEIRARAQELLKEMGK